MGPNFEFKNISRTWKKIPLLFRLHVISPTKKIISQERKFSFFPSLFLLAWRKWRGGKEGGYWGFYFHPSENGKRNKEPFLLHCGRKKGNVPRRVGNWVRAPKEVFRNVQGCKCEKVAQQRFRTNIVFSECVVSKTREDDFWMFDYIVCQKEFCGARE